MGRFATISSGTPTSKPRPPCSFRWPARSSARAAWKKKRWRRAGGKSRFCSCLLPQPMSSHLPETILQFGTGKFLRCFADLFIHEASEAGQAVGRVAVLQSTGFERAKAFNDQGGRYHVAVRGLDDGRRVDRPVEVKSVSRALVAATDGGGAGREGGGGGSRAGLVRPARGAPPQRGGGRLRFERAGPAHRCSATLLS